MITKITIHQHGDDGNPLVFEGKKAPEGVQTEGPFIVLHWPGRELWIPEHLIIQIGLEYTEE